VAVGTGVLVRVGVELVVSVTVAVEARVEVGVAADVDVRVGVGVEPCSPCQMPKHVEALAPAVVNSPPAYRSHPLTAIA
jgi:hypothetical protein